MNELEPLFFSPWKGSRYTEGLQGRRVLLLGESHYQDGPDYDHDGFTDAVVRRWAIQGPTCRFFTTTCRVMRGGPVPTVAQRTELWNSVAFYNYVQAWVGSGPRQRPTSKNWATGPLAFQKVLDALAPEIVVVLGTELWRHVALSFPHKPSAAPNLFTAGRVTIVAIPHPCSGRLRQDCWRPVIEAVLEAPAETNPAFS